MLIPDLIRHTWLNIRRLQRHHVLDFSSVFLQFFLIIKVSQLKVTQKFQFMYKYNYLTLPLLVHEYEELCSLALILWSLSVILLTDLKCLNHLICLSLQFKYLFLVDELIQSYSCLFPVWKNKEQFKLFNTINVIIKTMCMQCIGTFFFWKWLDKIFKYCHNTHLCQMFLLW